MASRRFNPRLIKTHRTYLVAEAAQLCGVHPNTIFRWIQGGLPTCDEHRPILILGQDLQAFLVRMRVRRKQQCRPDPLFCMPCRAPRVPLGRSVTYRERVSATGLLCGTCGQCGAAVFKASSVRKLREIRLHLDVSFTSAAPDIADKNEPFVNREFQQGEM